MNSFETVFKYILPITIILLPLLYYTDEDNNECPICYEEKNIMMNLNCRHSLCISCSSKIDHCPFCRKIFDLKTLINYSS